MYLLSSKNNFFFPNSAKKTLIKNLTSGKKLFLKIGGMNFSGKYTRQDMFEIQFRFRVIRTEF